MRDAKVTGKGIPGARGSARDALADELRDRRSALAPVGAGETREPVAPEPDPLGTETRPPQAAVSYTERDWPEPTANTGARVPPIRREHSPRGEHEPGDQFAEVPIVRRVPGSWDEPLMREV